MRRRFPKLALLALPPLALFTLFWRLGSADHSAASPAPDHQPLRVLILTGVANAAHDWKATTKQLQRIFGDAELFDVQVSADPKHEILAGSDLDQFDVLVLNFARTTRWPTPAEEGFLRFLRSKKGLVVLHAANNSFAFWPEFEQIIGGAWRAGSFHPPYGPFMVFSKKPDHPILDGIERFEVTDEMYCNLRCYSDKIDILAYAMGPTNRQGGSLAQQPIAWTTTWEGSRVFHLTLGHDVRAMQNPNYIRLVQRGALWATGRLGETVPPREVLARNR